MNSLILSGILIRQDEKGRYCLNDFHRAAGDEPKHKPANFLRLDATKALIEEIDQFSEMRSAEVINGGGNPGTFVVKELVYSYAMWISAKFHLMVIRAYDSMLSKPSFIDPMKLLSDPEAMRSLLLTYADKAIALQSEVDTLLPQAKALQQISGSEGSQCITDVAKVLKIQPKKLFEHLKLNKWIYKRPGGKNWLGYQDKIQSGFVDHKISVVTRGDGTEKTVEQVLLTPKGVTKLAKIFSAQSG